MTAVVTPQVLEGDMQLMRDARLLLVPSAADDDALLGLAGRYLDHDAPSMAELRTALAARLDQRLDVLQTQVARLNDWPVGWRAEGFNHCIRIASEALRYLASSPRPSAGEERFNSEHLLQLADDLARTLVTCFPIAPVAASAWPVLDAPARVDELLFRAGDSSQVVVESAQRFAAAAQLAGGAPLDVQREQEVARRARWERLNGPLQVPVGPGALDIIAARLGLPRSDAAAPGHPVYKIFGTDLAAFLSDMGIGIEEAQPLDLQLLGKQLLAPGPVVRDECGFWCNPALPLLDENVSVENFLAAFGLEACWVSAEDQLDVDEYDRLSELVNWTSWIPTPGRDGIWVLLSIHDTEGGPVASFVRPKQ